MTSGSTFVADSNPYTGSFAQNNIRNSPLISAWTHQTATDSARQINGNIYYSPSSDAYSAYPGSSAYTSLTASGSAQQMNGDIIWGSASPATGSGNVYTGIVAEGQSRQMNGNVYRSYPKSGDRDEGVGWPLDGPLG